MRKKLLAITVLLYCTSMMYAQVVTVTERSQLPIGSMAYHPVLSQDGSQLLFTTDNYYGLNLYDFSNQSTQTISTSESSGYKPYFNIDENSIYYKKVETKQARKHEKVMCFNTVHHQTKVCENESFIPRLSNSSLVRNNAAGVVAAYTKNLKLYIEKQGQTISLDPLGNESRYIWGSLSPDGTKILFTATGKGTYICDVNGTVLSNLGKLNAPSWCGNDKIVGMNDRDNGDFITSSQIVIKSFDGHSSQVLSLPKEIAMNPTATASGNKIAYHTIEGKIIVLNIK